MKAKRINLNWIKSIFTLVMIVSIYKIMSRLDVYAIACVCLVLVGGLAVFFYYMNEDTQFVRKSNPKSLQFQYVQKRKNQKFKSLKLEQLRQMDPYDFEKYVAKVLRILGYSDAHATGGAGDGGKDVIFTDPATSKKCYCECKRFGAKSVVTRPILQKLVGSALADNAIPYAIFTTGRFTKEAIDEAKKTGVKCVGPLQLLDMIERAEQVERNKEQVSSSELEITN